tara:strand:- start:1075 stop:2760 length:1686 start_codon:yes stop_codon:yes gene_type:complete
MRRAIGAVLVVLLLGCSGGGDTSTSVADDVGVRQAALPTTTTLAATTVAPASQLLEVPDLVGRSVDYAEGALAAIGLVIVVETRDDADGEAGIVFEQLPQAGGETTLGSPVVVRIVASGTTTPPTTRAPTTRAPTTTTPPATTTTWAPAVAIDENTVLTFAFVWGSSDEAVALQTLLGITADGLYGPGTQAAHVAELEARGLPTGNVPSEPATATTEAPAFSIDLLFPTTTTVPTATTTTAAVETTTTAAVETTTSTTMPTVELPGKVLNLAITEGDSQLSVAWTRPSTGGDPDGYLLSWANNNLADVWTDIETTQTSYVLSGLINGEAYTVWVFAYNSAGLSEGDNTGWAWSPTAPTTSAAPAVPSSPTITDTYVTGLFAWMSPSITVYWSAPDSWGDDYSFNGGYILERKVNDGPWAEPSGYWSGSFYQDSYSVDWGNSYSYRVTAYNSYGSGDPSAVVSVVPQTEPDDPDTIDACRIGDSSDYQVSWSNYDGGEPANGGSPITGYEVSWGDGSGTFESPPITITVEYSAFVIVKTITAVGSSLGESKMIGSYLTYTTC